MAHYGEARVRELRVANVGKTYGKGSGSVPALTDISLSVRSGEILSILGLNGAGKTTLVKILAGLIEPDTGQVSLDGSLDPGRTAYRKRIGAVFEGNRNIYWRLSAFENLEYFGVLRGLPIRRARTRADAMLGLFGLEDKRATIAAHLSRGMQQRLAVAISMVHEPEMLVLDEPTLGVDIENVLALVESLKGLARSGIAIVVTSHQFDVVKMIADRIALIVEGRLAGVETKQEFLASTGRHMCTLVLDGDVEPHREDQLAALGVTLEERTLRFPGDALYPVLDLVRPLPIVSLASGEADLAQVFLERIRGYAHA